jgi:peptidoglycan/LPS O-acetylase OafA/YrhL
MYPKRYDTFDAWRGAAALAVFFYHQFLTRWPLVGGLWLAVQLFFVISGYCIAAATDEAIRRRMSPGTFLRRRLRRIAPPYLASCLVAIVCRLMLKGFGPIVREWGMYLQNFAMMQWLYLVKAQLAGAPVHAASDNPRLLVNVYWSLNYEEQFYVVAAALLVVGLSARRLPLVVTVAATAAIAAFNLARPGLVSGVFIDYWLQFFCGTLLYYRLCRVRARAARGFDWAFLGLLFAFAYKSLRRGELTIDPHDYHFYGQLTVCLAFTFLLVLLRPLDGWFMRTAVGRLFGELGKFSYSLYLVHVPVMGLLGGLERRIRERLGTRCADLFMVAAVLGASWAFSRLFERPFLNRPLVERPRAAAPEPSVEVAPIALATEALREPVERSRVA